VDAETFSKYLIWHLFKGGVRTSTIDSLQYSKVLEDTLREGGTAFDLKLKQLTKKLEEYTEPKPVTKEDGGLRKRKDSLSHIMREAEKVESQEF
jgi:hypothetical protein